MPATAKRPRVSIEEVTTSTVGTAGIAPLGVPTPEAEPAPPPTPSGLPGHYSVFFHGNTHEGSAPICRPESWRRAYDCAGPALVSWLADALRFADARLDEQIRGFPANDGIRIGDAIVWLDRWSLNREHARERLADAAAYFKADVAIPPPLTLPRLFRYWEGASDFRGRIGHLLTVKQAELATVDAEMAGFQKQAARDFLACTQPSGNRMQMFWQTINQTAAELFGERSGGSIVNQMTRNRGVIFDNTLRFGGRGALDVVGMEIDSWLARREKLLSEIEVLQCDHAEATKLVVEAVTHAIKQGGGRDLVVDHLHSALCVGPPPEAPGIENEKHQCEATLEAKRMDGIADTAPSVVGLRERLAQLAERWQEVWRNRSSVQKARAKQLVETALTGDESARAELQGIVAGHPSDFRPGLADALADARLDRVLMAGLAQSLDQK
jgi:hypothetical protein